MDLTRIEIRAIDGAKLEREKKREKMRLKEITMNNCLEIFGSFGIFQVLF